MASISTPDEWPAIYKLQPLSHPINQKFISEIYEDKLVKDKSDAELLVSNLMNLIKDMLTNDPPSKVPKLDELKLISSSAFINPNNERLALLKSTDDSDVNLEKLILRYDSLAVGGQQWALPKAHFALLHDELGVHNEAFASPINSRLIEYPDSRYFSLFRDTDSPFGSKGNFFDYKIDAGEGNWEVNPPFMENVLLDAATKIIKSLEEAKESKQQLVFYFVGPGWSDAQYYLLLRDSEFKRMEQKLEYKRHFYESPSGETMTAGSPSFYFILAAQELSDSQKDKLPALMKTLEK